MSVKLNNAEEKSSNNETSLSPHLFL